MDYKAEVIFLPGGPAATEAIVSGEIDVGFESWPSYSTTKEKYIKEYGGDGSEEFMGRSGIVGQSGYYVPRYVVEGDAARGIKAAAPDLKSYADLNKYAALFQTPETAPKGRLVGCPVAAWQCMDKERLAGLGVDYVTVELGSETAQWAELDGAYQRGEPILVYAWEPHWVHAKYDLVEVELPEHSDAAWPVSDWPQDLTFHSANPTLKERYPDVYQLIKNLKLTNEQQAGMILDIDVNGMSREEAVRKWMAANEGVWRAWIPQ
jgi:ABC-type proline/glycine betaine transport system substrate-binding protein